MNTLEEQEHRSYMAMFHTEGWKLLVRDLTADSKIINDLRYTKDSDDLQHRKGQLSIIYDLLNLEENLKNVETL